MVGNGGVPNAMQRGLDKISMRHMKQYSSERIGVGFPRSFCISYYFIFPQAVECDPNDRVLNSFWVGRYPLNFLPTSLPFQSWWGLQETSEFERAVRRDVRRKL